MTIAFDVDGTLLTYDDKPRYRVVELFNWFYQDDTYLMIVWSGGGVEYAQQWIDRLGLDPENKVRVIEKGSEEVDIAVDDQHVVAERVKAKVIIKV